MAREHIERIKGRLDAIRYQGDNFWSVATLRMDRGQDVTIVGNLLTVSVGDSIELTGEWTTHRSFGRQFQFRSFEVLAPSSNEGVVGFLEGKLPDVGRNRAIEIVRHFGADKVFDVIANEPQRLAEISGITPERAERIHRDYVQVHEQRETLVFLKQFRLTDNQTAKIVSRYGMASREVLQRNPYQLIDDIDGFGFKTVDDLARRMGVDHHGLPRAKAGCVHVLGQAQDKGNTFLPLDELRRQVVRELAIGAALVNEAVKLLVEQDALVVENERAYTKRLHQMEFDVAGKLSTLLGLTESGADDPDPTGPNAPGTPPEVQR
jgi:exodeoxyribonuclease V alpha subunit